MSRALRPFRSPLIAATLLPLLPAAAVPYDNGPAVAFEHFEGSGSESVWGKGLSDLVEVDMAALSGDPDYAECEMAIVEWKRRDELIKELEFQQSELVDPATRLDPNKMIDPNVFVGGSVIGTDETVTWSITIKDADSGETLRTDTGTVPASEAFYVSESIARRIADFLCGLTTPGTARRSAPPVRRAYAGTVDIGLTTDSARINASGLVRFLEDSPGSGSFSSAHGTLNVQYEPDDCPAFNGALRLSGALLLDAPDTGQHMLALLADSFEINCQGISVPQDISGVFATCAPGVGGAADRDLRGAGGCGTDYRWQLSRR